MADKSFKNYDELIQILQNRGVIICTPNDIDFAKTFLQMKVIITLSMDIVNYF